jgi:hypothetical protein
VGQAFIATVGICLCVRESSHHPSNAILLHHSRSPRNLHHQSPNSQHPQNLIHLHHQNPTHQYTSKKRLETLKRALSQTSKKRMVMQIRVCKKGLTPKGMRDPQRTQR